MPGNNQLVRKWPKQVTDVIAAKDEEEHPPLLVTTYAIPHSITG